MKAIYNCVADNPDELTFSEGEVIVVDGEEDQEWWVSISQQQTLTQCAFAVLFIHKKNIFWMLAYDLRLKHKEFPVHPMSHTGPVFTMWMCSVTMETESKEAMTSLWPLQAPHHPPKNLLLLLVLLLFFRLLLLPLWSPLCEHPPAATCFPLGHLCRYDRI